MTLQAHYSAPLAPWGRRPLLARNQPPIPKGLTTNHKSYPPINPNLTLLEPPCPMSTTPQCPPPHISGRRESNESHHHGINDGSGSICNTHSYAKVDGGSKAVARDESLTEILISKGVQEVNLISAIVSLGEGETSYIDTRCYVARYTFNSLTIIAICMISTYCCIISHCPHCRPPPKLCRALVCRHTKLLRRRAATPRY